MRDRPTVPPNSNGLHPCVTIAVLLSIGVLAGDRWTLGVIPLIAVSTISAAATVAAGHRLAASIAVCGLIVSAGMLGSVCRRTVPDNDIARVVAQLGRDEAIPITVSGRIVSFVVEDSIRIRFNLAVERIHGQGRMLPSAGFARVSIKRLGAGDQRCSGLLRGARVELSGRLRQPDRNWNPADFNYRAFLQRKGISALLYVAKSSECIPLNRQFDAIARLRRWFQIKLQAHVPGSSEALSTALITGDRSGLDREIRQEFSDSGLMHLLAISGLHVLFVGLALYGLLKSALTRLRFGWLAVETSSCVGTCVVLICYTLVTGATPSVVRASIMAAVFLSSRPLYRTPNSLNSLGVAATTVLLIDPAVLGTAGFQLSFVAVFGLITAGVTVSRWVNRQFSGRAAKWCAGLFGASAVATISTSPIMIYHFGFVPMAGLVLNLAAIPLASFLLMASLLTAMASLVSDSVATTIGYSADLFATTLQIIASVGETTSAWSVLQLPARMLILLVPCALIFSLHPSLQRRTRILWLFVALALPGADVSVRAANGQFRPLLDVIFFDVGHGDAALVKLPSNKVLLVDAGNRARGWDFGERVILPHLKHERLDRIDAVVISHPHADHYGGLPAIIRSVTIGCVFDNGHELQNDLFAEYLQLIGSKVGCRRRLFTGSTLDIDPTVRFELLAPPPGYESEGENDESIVFRLTFGTTSILFTGDAESESERILVDHFCAHLRSDVVKVPHHGSRTSSTERMVECSSPQWAVVSVGRKETYGLPNREIIERWKRHGANVLQTRRWGAIQFRSDGHSIWRVL